MQPRLGKDVSVRGPGLREDSSGWQQELVSLDVVRGPMGHISGGCGCCLRVRVRGMPEGISLHPVCCLP